MVTIKDIANHTGVSCTTVSNVIHGRSRRVSTETVDKINTAIKELGYIPNMSARALVSSRSKVIAFVNHAVTSDNSNFLSDPFHATLIGILEKNLRKYGYYLMLRTVSNADELASFTQTWNVDGLFVTGVFQDNFFDGITNLTIPIVCIDSYIHHPNLCNVGLEDYNGCLSSTRYLLRNGHRKIAFVTPAIKQGGVIWQRLMGYKAALAEMDIPFDPQLVFETDMDIAAYGRLCDQLLTIPDLTGIITTADIIAVGLIAGFHQRNIAIPDVFSIVGFDDMDISQFVTPTLTTVHQDMIRKGLTAVEIMLDKLDGSALPQTEIILPTYLVERQSVRSI